MLRLLLVAALAVPATAHGQVMYNGYNLGPDYGAMIRQQQAIQARRNAEMQQQQNTVVQSAMQDPRCQQAYRQHVAQGGSLAYPNFAYECARTGRFTPEGMAFASRAEAQNRANELARLQSLRQAEANRAQAQQEMAHRFQRNNNEFGNYAVGQGTYVNPVTGAPTVLQNTRPGAVTTDPAAGQRFRMDNAGTQYVLAPDGRWVPMAPRH